MNIQMREITTEQRNYISNYVTAFEAARASGNCTDKTIGYQAFTEVDSFIDFFILNVLANNIGVYGISTYLLKDKNTKLSMGSIWDFKLAFGNAVYGEVGATHVWAFQFNECCPANDWLVPFWWNRLIQVPLFVQKLQERWEQLPYTRLSITTILGKISINVDNLTRPGAASNNFWGETHRAEAAYSEYWLTDSVAWLNTAMLN